MRSTGLAALFKNSVRLAPYAVLASAVLLSGCVDTLNAGKPSAAVEVMALPVVDTSPEIYAARSDGKYTVPGLPVEQIPESHRRQVVDYPTEQLPGTIIIDPRTKLLYYVMGEGKAIRYGISVGAEGFQWSGESIVARKGVWPSWHPPKEMIARKPSLEKWADGGQPGGPTNPLGSRAIYLTSEGRDYGYRIHGTPEWKSIGRNASSGCFRMIQQDVIDLYERVKGGEKVIVLTSKGEMPSGLSIPKPIVPKKKAAPKVEATPVADSPVIAGPTSVAPAGVAPATAVPAVPGATTPGLTPPLPSTTPDATTTAPSTGSTGPSVTTMPPSSSGTSLPAVNLPTVNAAPATPVTIAPAAPAPATATPSVVTPSAAAPVCALPLVNGLCPAN